MGKIKYSVTNFCKHNERLNPALSQFPCRAICTSAWGSAGALGFRQHCTLAWLSLLYQQCSVLVPLLSAHSAATACPWLCSAGFCMSISCQSSWGLCRLHDSACTSPPPQVKLCITTSVLSCPRMK